MQLASVRIQDGDVAQVAIELFVIEAAAYYEAVWDFETAEVDRHLRDAADGAVEQGADGDRARGAAGERLQQIACRQAGVDDVFDKQDVFALDGIVEILGDAHHTRGVAAEA